MSAPSPDRAVIRFVDVDGVRLRTSVRGSGRPLLLITGLGASLDLAAPFERELAARRVQTISFDAPGVGESTPYPLPRRMPGVARTVARMTAALGYDRLDVLGVSLGGVIAQQLARESPHLVRRLVLAATGPGLGGVPGSPRVLLALATPRRYHQPDYYRRIAGASTAVWPEPTPTHCCAARSPASSSRPACAATSGSSTRLPAGPASRGCGHFANPPSCWPATTTRSSRWSTAGYSAASSPGPAPRRSRRRPPVPAGTPGRGGRAGRPVPGRRRRGLNPAAAPVRPPPSRRVVSPWGGIGGPGGPRCCPAVGECPLRTASLFEARASP